jgi:hypothetical protein
MVQATEWLGDPQQRRARVPKGMRRGPNTTFFQVLVDMKNAANVVPGEFAGSGHDYRADLLPFFRAVLGIKVSDEQVQRLASWLENRELLRSSWVQRHGHADTSLAASLLTTWMRENRDQANEMIIERVRSLAIEDFVAGGGSREDAPVVRPKTVPASGT